MSMRLFEKIDAFICVFFSVIGYFIYMQHDSTNIKSSSGTIITIMIFKNYRFPENDYYVKSCLCFMFCGW